jgi:hypothetical protein
MDSDGSFLILKGIVLELGRANNLVKAVHPLVQYSPAGVSQLDDGCKSLDDWYITQGEAITEAKRERQDMCNEAKNVLDLELAESIHRLNILDTPEV